MKDGFSDQRRARNQFGQPLSPGDISSIKTLTRLALINELQPYLAESPNEKVVFVLGGEGCGKSWIVAQSWLELDQKPLMIILTPEALNESAAQNDINELLIIKLIEQTDNELTDVKRKFWQRNLNQWRRNPAVSVPRLIITIDGINQKPNFDWGRIIDNVAAALEKIGGRLIITSRTHYFRDRVEKRSTVPRIEINVPEWTLSERDKILTNYGIRPTTLHAAVAKSLLNPRLLGITVELFHRDKIAALEELSVSRLLFEHIRATEINAPTPQPAVAFVRQLREHAQKILKRKQQSQRDDLNIFETDTLAVADGRFFQPVEGDPEKYQLMDDGLTLALGFSVVDILRSAKRNNHDLDVTLTTLLEPISALDSSADVVLAALTVTIVDDDQYIPDIAVALIKGFVELQNPDQTKFPPFAGLTKRKPLAFMNAAHDLCLGGAEQHNFDWVKFSIIEASKVTRIWPEIASQIELWLSAYSSSPELGMRSHHSRESNEQVQAVLDQNQQVIDEKVAALSDDERNILNRLHQKDGDINALTRFGLFVLAGKPLAPFADYFVNWSFSTSLNSDYSAPRKDFRHLISLNQVDWQKTRTALLKSCAFLRGSHVSSCGKWALVTILSATGDEHDDKEARALVNELWENQSNFKDWRRVENYCATDPCDPASTEPENINLTAEQYQAIDVNQLRGTLGVTSENDFFVVALPGMARFKPEVAISKYCAFAENVLTRKGFPLRQGLFELHKHNVLLTSIQAQALVSRWREAKSDGTLENMTVKDSWIVSQYLLLLAFPFLNANQQTEILLSIDESEPVLLDLIKSMNMLDESSFERWLVEAYINADEFKHYLLLAIAKSTNTPLSPKTRQHIPALIKADSERLRAEALGIIARSGDKDMLACVVQSGWKAANAQSNNGFEEWYGSLALLEAAVKDLIDHLEVLDRISPKLYGRAGAMLNAAARREIARRIDVSIRLAIGLGSGLITPDIQLDVWWDTAYGPNRFILNEKTPQTQDITETLKRFNENSCDFEERQQRCHDIFLEFENTLTKANAYIILNDLKLDEFASIVAADEEIADEWYKLFLELPDSNLSAVYNLILLLAYAQSSKDPNKAVRLFQKVRDHNPTVRFTFGPVGIELDAMATWGAESSAAMDEQLTIRLDQAATDHDISLEVLAGLINGRHEYLSRYVDEKLKSDEPAKIARGIMVIGFSDFSDLNTETLSSYENTAGLIGSAYKAAKYAYERNCWARHWFKQICEASEPIDYWRSAILFHKIVDGRFATWNSEYPQKGKLIHSFGQSTFGSLKNRYDRWKQHRKKKLFGIDAPDRIFLQDSEYGS